MSFEPEEEPFYDGPDRDDRDEPDPLEEAIRATRNRNLADGQVAFAVAHLLATTSPRECLSARTLVAGEIGPALGLGSGAATKLVDAVAALRSRLTTTFTEVRAGRLRWYYATLLVERTAPLTDAQARAVEDVVLPRAEGQTPARFTDALRRAVDRIDPDGADARRKQAKQDVKLIRAHHGDGMGQLFARMGSEQLDAVWTGADFWARERKAEGDKRSLDQLRVAALVQWAQSYLHHGDPTYCDRWCTPGSHGGPVDDPEGETPPASTPPTRHGRPAVLHVLWDVESLLGRSDQCGELADSGAALPPDAMRELVAGGVAIRRMVIDPSAGELLDLTPRTWQLHRTATTELRAPVVLSVIVSEPVWRAIQDGSADPALLAAIETAHPAIREMLQAAWSADDLDNTPAAYPAPARLAEFVAVRDRHPVNPTAGPSSAAAADLDHPHSFAKGGKTVRDNLAATVRYWHRLKTLGGWHVQRHGRGWQWTSPQGRRYYTEPYDYRLGP